jgi:hypothetical protein
MAATGRKLWSATPISDDKQRPTERPRFKRLGAPFPGLKILLAQAAILRLLMIVSISKLEIAPLPRC